ncbi:MAG: hypothetical protein ACKESB_01875 [Candidatus Hodgkinia cicadicola]
MHLGDGKSEKGEEGEEWVIGEICWYKRWLKAGSIDVWSGHFVAHERIVQNACAAQAISSALIKTHLTTAS